MENKKVYTSPAIKIVFAETVQPIAASQSGGNDAWTPAKEHNSFWDSWGDDDEDDESTMLRQSKSLWD